jgi:hypothetical protein
MSAIASFFRLPLSAIDGLRAAAQGRGYYRFLIENGVEVVNFKASGYVFATLLPYLQEREIDLMKSERDELSGYLTQTQGATHFIFTAEHRSKYLESLDAQLYTEAELRDYYNDFNGCSDQQAGIVMLDGIKALQKGLASLSDEQVILFMIA